MTTPDYNQLRTVLMAVENAGEQWRDDFWTQAAQSNSAKLPTAVTNKLLKQGFNHSEMQILSQVAQHTESGLAYQDLVKLLPFSQGMLSRYVKKLTTNELLTRFHQNNNQKAVFLAITPTGQLLANMHQQMHIAENQHYNQVLQQFSTAELATTQTVLQALAKQ